MPVTDIYAVRVVSTDDPKEIYWLLVLLGPERIHFTKEIISLLQLVRASEVNIAATTHMGNWLSMETDAAKIEVSATFLFHKFRLYDLDPVIYKEFANFDTLLDDAHTPTSIHTGASFLKLLLANPEVAEGLICLQPMTRYSTGLTL